MFTFSAHQQITTTMDDTLVRAKKQTEQLRQSLRLLMENNTTKHTAKEPQPTFFDDFKENVRQVQNTHYVPPKRAKEPEPKKPDYRPSDLLVSKLERQNLTIETLEAEVRRLTHQNHHLGGVNQSLREQLESRSPQPQQPERPQKQQAEPIEQPDTAKYKQEVSRLGHVIAELREQHAREQSQNRHNRQLLQELHYSLRACHEQYQEAVRKWEAAVSINRFNERVIRDLKKQTVPEAKEAPLDTTEDLLHGNLAETEDGLTTRLINGEPVVEEGTYDHYVSSAKNSSQGNTRTRFRAAALAALFCVRLHREAHRHCPRAH